jgi:hypothetical protein
MELIPRPSGKRLPLFLLKKWRAQQNMAKDESSSSDHQQPDQPSRLTRTEASTLSNRVFAAEELEDRLYKTSVVITDMQKQIQRGEEICKSTLLESCMPPIYFSSSDKRCSPISRLRGNF